MKKSILLTTLASLAMSQITHAMVISEWGTFTSLQGSDGKDQIGVYHDDEKLPDFVHGLGYVLPDFAPPASEPVFPRPGCSFKALDCDYLRSNRITQRMETPVIYFYHNEPTEQKVTIDIGFPEGVISETFPAPLEAFPGAYATNLTNGKVKFQVSVLPANSDAKIPAVPAGNIYGHARSVNSNKVRAQKHDFAPSEYEKFIFYRGVGKFKGSLEVVQERDAVYIKNITPSTDQKIPFAMLVHTNAFGESTSTILNNIEPGQYQALKGPTLHYMRNDPRESLGSLKRSLIYGLTRAGLTSEEALSMIETWGHGYLQTPGTRILYVLAPETTERILPMKITPAPEKLTRVLVGRLEILTKEEEKEILQAVSSQGQNFTISTLGRFAEAKLRAVKAVAERTTPISPSVLQDLDVLIDRAGNMENI